MTQTSQPLLEVGDVLAGKYRVERVLGQGAMGVVVAAMHVDLHERRAIKFMLPSALGDTEGVERFMREARACARLKSKHAAAVYDVGRLENGAPYIVMEYLEGTDLKDVLHRKKALSVAQSVDYMLQALEAVGEAHQAGIVHRDLKPANMFLAAGVNGIPCIKILDFGIAKLAPSPGFGAEHHEMTTTAMIMGSPLYMSPEQMRSSRDVDARCDIWSLGVILYRMVTGTLPFQAPTAPEIFAMVLTATPREPSALNPTLPEGFEAILLKCLEKDPAQRWSSAAELASALRPYAAHSAEGNASSKDADSIPRPSRPSQTSTDGLHGPGSQAGSGSDSTRKHAGGPPSASGSAQSQTGAPASESGPVPFSARGGVDSTSNPLVQTGSSGGASAPPGVSPEAGPTGQTGGSWSQTGMRPHSPGGVSRGLALAVGLGGGLFFVGVVVLIFMSRGNSAASGNTPPQQPEAAVQPVVQPAQDKPAPSPSAPEPAIVLADTSTAPSSTATADATAKPPATTAATQKAPSKTTTTATSAIKRPPKDEKNPFDD